MDARTSLLVYATSTKDNIKGIFNRSVMLLPLLNLKIDRRKKKKKKTEKKRIPYLESETIPLLVIVTFFVES